MAARRALTRARLCALLAMLLTGLPAAAAAGGLEDARAGRAALRAGNAEEAIRFSTQAIASGELAAVALASAYNTRGVAHRRQGRLAEALADYDTAIRLRPDYAFAYNNRGIAHQSTGAFEKAVADHTQAITIDPNYAHAYAARCLALEQLGRREDAVADCRAALARNPELPSARTALDRMGARP